jgi:hypothetical protein
VKDKAKRFIVEELLLSSNSTHVLLSVTMKGARSFTVGFEPNNAMNIAVDMLRRAQSLLAKPTVKRREPNAAPPSRGNAS